MANLKQWFRNARPTSLVQSLTPALTAVVLSLGKSGFSPVLALLAVVGVACAHLAFNLLDDYFDYKSHLTGYRETLARAGFRAYTAKCPYLTDGSATLADLKRAIAGFSAVALVCGAVVLWRRGTPVLVIVAITAFLGWFYSGAPLRLSYHGLGELVIGVIFGPLNVIGTSLAACGALGRETVLAGVVFGLQVTNILYSHSVLDFAADQSVDKRTLAALFPNERARLGGSAVLILAPYVLAVLPVCLGWLSPWFLLLLLTLPLAVDLYRSMVAFTRDPKAPVVWKKWYGKPAVDWAQAQAMGLDWFLQRWLLAQHLVAASALCWSVAGILSKVV